MIEPLSVVDDADERLLLGDLGEERERGESDQEPVGCRPRAEAEDRRERVVLREGQPLEMVEHGRAELMEAAVGQLHLRLDPDRSRDTPAGDAIGQIAAATRSCPHRLPLAARSRDFARQARQR